MICRLNNVLIEGEIVHLIDFGLASIEYDVERFGIDLHVLDEILGASHPQWEGAIDWAIEGYLACEQELGPAPVLQGGAVPSASEVHARLEDIPDSRPLSWLTAQTAFTLPLPHVPRHHHKSGENTDLQHDA